jgi:hypothetical protein
MVASEDEANDTEEGTDNGRASAYRFTVHEFDGVRGSTLLMFFGSYAEHQDATYRTYGFLLVSEPSFVVWRHLVAPVRTAIGDAREFAYKKMRSDGVRRREIASFLRAADVLNGAWLTVAFNADAYNGMSGGGWPRSPEARR